MPDIMICVFLFSLLTADVLSDRPRDYEDSQQGGRSFFFLGGLFRRIKSRWQNQNLPLSPYGGGPIFAGYYGCSVYNCRPPQFQVVQPVQAIQPVAAVQTVPAVSAVVQTPIVVQQAQIYQPNTFAQAVAQPNTLAQAVAQPNSNPVYPVQTQPQSQQFQYPVQPIYGSPQPAYGNPQPYQPYPVYPSAYASASVPGQIYQNAACAYPGYPCGRKT